ncbi:MAG TPA: hypothetical protein VE964_07695 [Myxococcales bacterium]|nr:hypothetical protein [Myxococcales bacterium]
MLRPSGTLLASSRSAHRRMIHVEAVRLFKAIVRGVSAVVTDVAGSVADLLVMLGLPILYAVAAYLTFDLPARLFAGQARFSSTGLLVFLAALGVSFLGLSRMLRGAAPVAPVRPKFARAMLLATWAAGLLLTLADLAG